MFTGIIEEQGLVRGIIHQENLSILTIQVSHVMEGMRLGDSLSINGVCLSVTQLKNKTLSFDLMSETLKGTNLGQLKISDHVNLERALQAKSRFGGHFVTGHVDAMGQIEKIIKLKNYVEFQVRIPARLKKFLVRKGSICIDGVSLTIGNVSGNLICVHLIPVTLRQTIFGQKNVGESVNIETDIVARYLLRRKRS